MREKRAGHKGLGPRGGGHKAGYMDPQDQKPVGYCRCVCGGSWFVEAYGVRRHTAHAGMCLHLACMVRTYRPAHPQPRPAEMDLAAVPV